MMKQKPKNNTKKKQPETLSEIKPPAPAPATKKSRRKRNSTPKANAKSKEWQLPNALEITHIDPLFRHRLQLSLCEVLLIHQHIDEIDEHGEQENMKIAKENAVKLERRLSINCNFCPELYEEMATLLLYALEKNPNLIRSYDISMIISLDEEHLLPNGSICEFQRNRKLRRICFESLLKKLTSDVAPDGHPLLQCRKCNSQADFNPVQTRSADEPMTIFCTCLNPDCKSQWKMAS